MATVKSPKSTWRSIFWILWRQQNQLLLRWGGGALKPVFSKELVLVEWRRSSIFFAYSLRRFELWTRLLFQDTYLTSCEVKSARQNKNPIFFNFSFFAWCIEGILYPKRSIEVQRWKKQTSRAPLLLYWTENATCKN